MSSAASTKNEKGESKQPAKSKLITHSTRAGLEFPVGRVATNLKKDKYSQRVGAEAPIFLTAVMEFLAAEVLELAGNEARESQRNRIAPRHIQMAVTKDKELRKLFEGVTIASGGANPNFNQPPITK